MSNRKHGRNRGEKFAGGANNAVSAAGTVLSTPGVNPNDLKIDRQTLMREIGSSGLMRFGGTVREEFLRELQGRKGMLLFREMRENHPVINAVFFAIEMALRQVKWYAEPASDKPEDQEKADFLDECLEDMSYTWNDTLAQIITMLQFGFSIFEQVYKPRKGRAGVLVGNNDERVSSRYDDGRIGWRKWMSIAQDTLAPGSEWIFDTSGEILGVRQMPPPDWTLRTIPIQKMLHFRTTVSKNNPEGRSLCRGMYTSWWYAKNLAEIEAIGAERMGAGVPVMYMGEDTAKAVNNNSDLELAKSIVRDIKFDEQMGIVIPYPKMGGGAEPGNGMLLELLSPPGRDALNIDVMINRYEKRMALVALAEFIMLGMEKVGSYALSKDLSDVFIMALGAWAETIVEQINRFAVPRLFELNTFGSDDLPEFAHSEVAVPDLAALGTYINQLAGANVITPDTNLEAALREMAHLPEKSEDAINIQTPMAVPTQPAPGDTTQPGTPIGKPVGPGAGVPRPKQPTTAVTTGPSPEAPPAQAPTNADLPKLTTKASAHEHFADTLAQARRARGGARYETATNAYQKELETLYTDWYGTLSKKLAQEADAQTRDDLLKTSLSDFEDEMKAIGRQGLLGAMQIGAAGEPLTTDGLQTLSDLVQQNDAFIESSLVPAIQDKARKGLMDDLLVAGGVVAISGLFATFLGRVASYSGSFWQSIHEGIGVNVKQRENNGTDLRVQVNLDPGADHCEDCPRLTGIYANWDDMLARSGIPSSLGRSRCNCRCYLTIESSPGSDTFERV